MLNREDIKTVTTARVFLSSEFLGQEKYKKRPKNAGPLFEVTYLRTYSRWLPELKRRETWAETIRRVVEYSISLYQGPATFSELVAEAELMFDKVFNLEVLPAGRTLWVGGTDAATKYSIANFNCSYLNIERPEAPLKPFNSFGDIFYLLLCGCGVGYGIQGDLVNTLPKLKTDFEVVHREYSPIAKKLRSEETISYEDEGSNSCWVISIGDSKEAWVQALMDYFDILETSKEPIQIEFYYNNIRPAGERLVTFGGRAAGPKGLEIMFNKISSVIKKVDGRLTPVAAMDIANMIAENVLVGGTRRSAQIALGSPKDSAFKNAKLDLYTKIDGKWKSDPNKSHRKMSNNSIVYDKRPVYKELLSVFKNIMHNGEPGFYNKEAAMKRRPKALGVNPCVTLDTWISTGFGPRQVKELLEQPFTASINSLYYPATPFWKTGTKPVHILKTKEGYEIRLTEDHKVLTQEGWIEAANLKKGQKILLNNPPQKSYWKGEGTFTEGWLLGSMVGDGHLSTEAGCVRYWGNSQSEMAARALDLVDQTIKHRSDLKVVEHKVNKTSQVLCVGLKILAEKFGLSNLNKVSITPEIEKASSEFYIGYLQGLFDADGSVQGNVEKGRSIRLSQINYEFLQGIQRMLLRLGITSTIYGNRTEAGFKVLPNGKGGHAEYFCKALHELVISRASMRVFKNRVGFSEPEKVLKLTKMLENNTRGLYLSPYLATFSELVSDGEEDVYDCSVEEVHRFDANGMIVHNCGEILLDNFGVCNLSTVVITSHMDENGLLDVKRLQESFRLAARIGLRQTNITLSLPHWDKVQKRDRLIGVSMTGLMRALDLLRASHKSEYAKKLLKKCRMWANTEAEEYSNEMGISKPLLVTCCKPEGTQTLLSQATSPGLHRSFAPYYIRRISVSELDPVSKALISMGVPHEYKVEPEKEDEKNNPRRILFSFPISSGATMSADDESSLDQLDRYLTMQRYYTDHNSSCTLYLGRKEWKKVAKQVHKNWEDIVACAFLPKNEAVPRTFKEKVLDFFGKFSTKAKPYPQMPYEEISKEQYDEMMKTFPELSNLGDVVNSFEYEEAEEDVLEDADCKGGTGSCPIR